MVTEGLDRDLVLSELNKFEFSFREEASKPQRGLDLIGKAMTGLKYDTDPIAHLMNEELIQTLRHKALNDGYFEELIKKFLLDNPSTVTVTLVPDPKNSRKARPKNSNDWRHMTQPYPNREKNKRIERTSELMQEQQQPNSIETLSLLPQLNLSDLSTKVDFHTVAPTAKCLANRCWSVN